MNLSRFFFLGALFLFLFLSCKNKKESSENLQKIVSLDSLSTAKINLNLLKLSGQAEQDLESFEDLKNLRSFMKSFRNFNPYYIQKNTDSLEFLMQTFEETLSKDLDVNTINSRISVISTEIGLLRMIFENKNPTPEKVLEANTGIVKAYNSLIIQLNELSLTVIPENIEKELLRDFDKDEEEKNKK